MSYKYRKGTRTKEKFQKDLFAGIRRSKMILLSLEKFITEQFEKGNLDYWIKAKILEEKKLYKKFFDTGDVKLEIHHEVKNPKIITLDVEVCPSDTKETAAIKSTCIERCFLKGWGMLIALYPKNPVMGFYVKDDFDKMTKTYDYNETMYEYGNENGKGGWRIPQEEHWFSLEENKHNLEILNSELKRIYNEI